jgi:hypothetical protein
MAGIYFTKPVIELVSRASTVDICFPVGALISDQQTAQDQLRSSSNVVLDAPVHILAWQGRAVFIKPEQR